MNRPDVEVNLIECTTDALDMLITVEDWVEGPNMISIDTETGSIHDLWKKDRGFCRLWSIGTKDTAFVVPAQGFHNAIQEALDIVSRTRVAYANWKYDYHVMRREGWKLPPTPYVEDVLTMHHLVRPEQNIHALKMACVVEFGVWASEGQAVLKDKMHAHGWTWETIPLDEAAYWFYAGFDTCLTARLAESLQNSLDERSLYHAYNMEMAYSDIMYNVEQRGMRVDKQTAFALSLEYKWKIDDLAKRLNHLGIKRPTSNRAVEKALAQLGFEPDDYTDNGAAKLDKVVLSKMRKELGGDLAEAADLLMQHRRYSKWRAVYADKLLESQTQDGKVHPNIKTLGAKTGRSSVTDPPLQTIPKDAGPRGVFYADPGCELWAVDYDSQEAAILASVSNEPSLIKLFTEGDGDIHGLVARELGISRNDAKTGVYAKLFGAGAATIGAALGGGLKEGEEFERMFANKFPQLQRWFDSVLDQGYSSGYVTLPDSRRLHSPHEPYKLINYAIQGRGAIILKQAALALDKEGLADHIVMVVHDEILFQFKEGEGVNLIPRIVEIMTTTIDNGIELSVQAEGPFENWGQKYGE